MYGWTEAIKFLSKWNNDNNFILVAELHIISWVLVGPIIRLKTAVGLLFIYLFSPYDKSGLAFLISA